MDTLLSHNIFFFDAHLQKPLDDRKNESITSALIDELLHALGLEKLGSLQIYPATDLRAPGWSFIQTVTTSHISGHYFEKPGQHPNIHMDFYSCTPIEWQEAIRICDARLSFLHWQGTYVNRSLHEPDRSVLNASGAGGGVEHQEQLQSTLNKKIAAVTSGHMRAMDQ